MNKFYPLQHWLATLSLAPLFLELIDKIEYSKHGIGVLDIYPLILEYGLLFSVPALLVYYLAFYFVMSRSNLSLILLKVILDIIAIACLMITCLVLDAELKSPLFIGYSITIILSSLFLKLRNKLTGQVVKNEDTKK